VSRRVTAWTTEKSIGSRDALTAGNVEQYIRDSKIDSLDESTTAVQAQDVFRKIACDRGRALADVAGEIPKFVDSDSAVGRSKPERALPVIAFEDAKMRPSRAPWAMSIREWCRRSSGLGQCRCRSSGRWRRRYRAKATDIDEKRATSPFHEACRKYVSYDRDFVHGTMHRRGRCVFSTSGTEYVVGE